MFGLGVWPGCSISIFETLSETFTKSSHCKAVLLQVSQGAQRLISRRTGVPHT